MNTPVLSIPSDLTRISPEWMTAALARDHPGARVGSVDVALRDDGTNRRARLNLEYSAGVGPASVFVKATDPRELLKLTSGIFHEPNLFNTGVTLPIEHPRVHCALLDEDEYDFILVMEDIGARAADPRDATAGSSAPASVLRLTMDELLEDVWKPYIRGLATSDQTLLHGDPHIGNTYVLPDGTVGFLDWQVVRRGNWSLDVGYFLQGALTVEDRRAHERDLLGEYLGALGLPAAETPDPQEVWLRYRASAAHGLTLWLATLSAGDLWQRPDIALALAQCYAAAFDDLDTRDALARCR